MYDIGPVLRTIRHTLGLTQAEVASRMGRSTQSVSRWENASSVTTDTMLSYLHALGVDAFLQFRHPETPDSYYVQLVDRDA